MNTVYALVTRPEFFVRNRSFGVLNQTLILRGYLKTTTRLIWVLSALTLFVIDNSFAQQIRYVKPIATGSGSGADWNNASADLQGMVTASSSGDQVWVAAGRYIPAINSSFSMKEGVAVYGGFAGSEQRLQNRPVVNPVIGSPSGTTLAGNGSRVINNPASLSLTETAVLDGFVITGGGNVEQGGGMYNRGNSPTVRNCSFSENTATGTSGYGGAMYNFSDSSPILTNCLFSQNSTVVSGNSFSNGGAIYNFNNSSPILTNCLFSQNSSSCIGTAGGGAMYNISNSSPVLINCSFNENTISGTAFSNGGAMHNFLNSSPQLINCSFRGNTISGTPAFSSGSAIYNDQSSVEIINSILFGNGGASAIGNVSSVVTARYSLFEDGVTGFTSDPTNITGVTTSPFAGTGTTQPATNSPAKDRGDVASYTAVGGPPADLAGNPRFAGTGYAIDMGAYEDQSGGPYSVLIVQQPPAASAVCTGSVVTVTVSATGTAPGYQWYKDGMALSGISSATTASLQLINVSVADAGSYSVVATGGGVSVTSTAFSLTVGAVPSLTITAAPSLTIVSGNSVTLTAAGASSYSWSTGASTSVISVSTTGTYSVTGITGGCSSTTSLVVKGQFTIGDRVYFDINGNGSQNAGEPGIPGTIINALWFGPNNSAGGGDDVLYSTTTGADGIWSLTVLDTGTYRVSATPPASQGWVITDSFDNNLVSGTNPVTPLITESRNNIDFGFRSTGQVGGLVFNDIDRNGSQNAPSGEQGRSGVTIRLRYDANANGTLTDTDDGSFTVVTNASGVYSFSFLPPGTYQAEILPAGLPANSQPTYDPDGVATPYSTTLTLTLGQSLTTVNFGYATVCYPVIYVTQAGAGSRDGSSWSNAYSGTALQTAIDAAAGCSGQVWVATGTYKPTSTNARDISFTMRNNVAIYGSFLGSETALSGRPAVNPVTGQPGSSTLSGEIGNPNSLTDNSERIINNPEGLSLTASAILDGFVIAHAYTNSEGGGVNNETGNNPIIRQCVFLKNHAGSGGGMYTEGSSPVVTDCLFQSNTAATTGGGFLSQDYSTMELNNCVFSQNVSGDAGGGVYNSDGSMTLTNCSFLRNTANSGAGINNIDGSVVITGCSFISNSAITGAGGGLRCSFGEVKLENCIIQDNFAYSIGGGGVMADDDATSVTVKNCLFKGNRTLGEGAGVAVNTTVSSPVLVVNSSFVNNKSDELGGGISTKAQNSLTAVNSSFQGNEAGNNNAVSWGAVTDAEGATFINCVEFGNTAGQAFYGEFRASYCMLESASYTALLLSGTNNLTATVSPFASTTGTELAACSPAINAGNPSTSSVLTGTTDLAGNNRFFNGGRIDMGAYEFQGEGQPVSFSVLGSGTATCAASPTITLSGSEAGVSYQLRRNDVNTGAAVPGTGSALSFGPQSLSGTYTVLATGGVSCTLAMTGSATVVSTTAVISASLVASGAISCNTPSVTLTASPANLTYTFGSGATRIGQPNQATVNTAGPYSVTVSDTGGCSAVAQVTVNGSTTAPTAATLTASGNGTLTCGRTALTLTASANGDGLSYAFSGPGVLAQNGSSATVNAAGNYSVVITGSNSCTSSATTTLYSNTTPPSLSVSPSIVTLTCASPSAVLSVVGTGDARWSTGAAGPVISVTAAGTYSVTLTDAGGCTAVADAVVSASLLEAVTVTAGSALGCGVLTTTVRVEATGATSFTLLGPNGYTQTNSTGIFSVSAGGSYTGFAGQSDCVLSKTVVVIEGGAQPTISSIQATGTLGNGVCSVSVQGNGLGDRYELTGPSGYVFSVVYRTAAVRTVVFPAVSNPGTYTMTVYSGNCVVTRTVAVNGTTCP